MGNGKRSGGWGFLGVIGCAVLYVLSRRFFPSLSTALHWIIGGTATVLLLLVGVVIVLAFHKPKKTPAQEQAEAQQAVVKQARADLMALRTGAMRIKNSEIRERGGQVCAAMERILRALQDQPEDIPTARSFLRHSLPMAGGIVQKYARLEQSGIPTAEMTAQTARCLQDLETAAGKQYENLFADDVVDITAEMEVLTRYCRKNGLLDENLLPTEKP